MSKRIGTTIFCVAAILASSWGQAASKVALVIGNSEYNTVSDRLKNPVNDAKAIAQTLKASGYQTTLVLNASLDRMLDGLNQVKSQVDVGGTIVFYYAGHGVQFEGQNFLVPVNARLADRDRAMREAVLLQEVVRKLDESGAAAKVLIIDACRNDPFPKTYRSSSRGLARMQDQLPAKGLMIMYAASPGEVAADGQGMHGAFTEALLQELGQSQERLTELMDNIVDSVRQKTAGKQNPYYEGTGLSRLVLATGQLEGRGNNVGTTSVPAPMMQGGNPVIEAGFWQSIANSSDLDDFKEYLARFPDGSYVYLAQKKIKQIQDELNRRVEEGAWQSVDKSEQALFEFLQKFPNGVYAAQAQQKLDAIRAERYARSDEEKWQTVANSLQAQSFKEYLAAFPSGKYAVQARDKYNQLLEIEQARRDEDAWAVLINSSSYLDFQAYIDKFPQGKYLAQAKVFFEKYKKQFDLEDKAWQMIANSKNPADFEKHMRLFPQGVYAQSAQEKRDAYKAEQNKADAIRSQDEELWRNAKRAWTLDSLKNYLATFPRGIHGEEAQQGVLELEHALQRNKAKQEDDAEWRRIVNSRDSKDFIRYQAVFPQGQYLEQARKILKKLESAHLEELDEQRWQGIKDKKEASVFTDYLADFPQGNYREEAQQLLARFSKMSTMAVMPLKAIQDCPDCPALVVVPKGSVAMGDGQAQPAHKVSLNYELAVGKYEVTVGQYKKCLEENACDRLAKGIGDTDQHPVTNVRWQDAQNYINWLSAKTHQYYRLPSEAEWEYFARAGSMSPWFYGFLESDACLYGNIADINNMMNTTRTGCDDRMARAAPVGTYQPNAFGLYDVIGNAYEWVQDCYQESYNNAPADGSPWLADKCNQRVLRGGAWTTPAAKARSSSRMGFDATDRFYVNGFRVVRVP